MPVVLYAQSVPDLFLVKCSLTGILQMHIILEDQNSIDANSVAIRVMMCLL